MPKKKEGIQKKIVKTVQFNWQYQRYATNKEKTERENGMQMNIEFMQNNIMEKMSNVNQSEFFLKKVQCSLFFIQISFLVPNRCEYTLFIN